MVEPLIGDADGVDSNGNIYISGGNWPNAEF